MKSISGTQYICSSCTLCCMLSKLYAYITIECMTNVLWPTIRKFIYFWKCFHAESYTALENHVPLPRFPETFSMWYRIVFGTKWHRFHYCCNLWWVQPLYCINTLDYIPIRSSRSSSLWRHQMETSSALLALCVRGIPRSPVNSPHKGQSRGALMFSLICVWTNGWVNNRVAGDLRRRRAHCDVTAMLRNRCNGLAHFPWSATFIYFLMNGDKLITAHRRHMATQI